jgi:hypothetical protein
VHRANFFLAPPLAAPEPDGGVAEDEVDSDIDAVQLAERVHVKYVLVRCEAAAVEGRPVYTFSMHEQVHVLSLNYRFNSSVYFRSAGHLLNTNNNVCKHLLLWSVFNRNTFERKKFFPFQDNDINKV